MDYRMVVVLNVFIISFFGCSKNDENTSEATQRNFNMGFTTWSYGPNPEDVAVTYEFIKNNADIYTEHIDYHIPWDSWINDLPLPAEFTGEIAGRVQRKIEDKQLLLSVGLLNLDRDELTTDYNDIVPSYTGLNDVHIEDAYFKHVKYLVDQLKPDFLVIAIEVNELRLKEEGKWQEYTLLIKNVKLRIKQLYPNLKVSESISLHNLYNPTIINPNVYIDEMIDYMNQLDFVAISFYPFLKNQHSESEFQQTFDFLHKKINRPIAFVESGHIAEDLSVSSFDVFIPGNAKEQDTYLKTLFANAREQDYEFVIWWAYRDFDALWETFPDDRKDQGKLWRDAGLIDEEGKEREAFVTWKSVLSEK
ncbi:glycosyl hydrolase 53 family protein [Aquimarina sp. 2201CG1-2-11]|uniref:glycosyl hydrolase 53 family protein n=1 Tax=Aquimarina discodermiae TaxID=3231043 RepID=UPI003461FCEA